MTVRGPQPHPDPARWLTTAEVATRLGIKRATVYAYVSRGVLHRVRPAGRRDSWFDLIEIEQFASNRSGGRSTPPPLSSRPGERVDSR